MKLKNVTNYSVIILLFIFSFASLSYSKELPANPNKYQNFHFDNVKFLAPNHITEFSYQNFFNKKSDKPLEVQYLILDSIRNAYSYFGNQQPIVYDPKTNILATIRRGLIDPKEDPTYTGIDTKNNLFIRWSEDNGFNWNPPVLVYDAKVYNYGEGRYPSLYTYEYSGEQFFIYTAPLVWEAQSTWVGFVSGYYSENQGGANVQSESVIKNDVIYLWSTDSKIVGKTTATDEPLSMAPGALFPETIYRSLTDNSNLGLRRTTDFTNWYIDIPPTWNSTTWHPVDTIVARANEIINMRMSKDGSKFYFAVFGNFKNGENDRRAEAGVSVSTDDGLTWSDFEIFPYSLVEDYVSLYGINPDSVYIPFNSKDFVVWGNGDYSIILQIYEYTTKSTLNEFHAIVELYYNSASDSWTLYPITTEITGYWLPYYDSQEGALLLSRNQLDLEIQACVTEDGNTIMAKWTDLIGVQENPDNTVTWQTNDIFVATRKMGDDQWSGPINITNDYPYDRNTWFSYIIPNNLKQIPFLKMETIPDPNLTEQQNRSRQLWLEERQYLEVGHIDLGPTSVKENNLNYNLAITSISPNPANSDNADMNFTIPYDGKVLVEVYNTIGNKVLSLLDLNMTSGIHSVEINTKDLPSGAYFVNLIYNNQKISKLLNVIK